MVSPPVLKEVIVTIKPPYPGFATALDWAGNPVLKYGFTRKVAGSVMTVKVTSVFEHFIAYTRPPPLIPRLSQALYSTWFINAIDTLMFAPIKS